MTPKEKEEIRTALQSVANTIRIGLHRTDDDRGKQFQSFADELQSLLPGIKVDPQDHQDRLPCLKIADNVSYRAIPMDKELAPFLDYLSGVRPSVPLPPTVRNMLSQVNIPAELTVFVALQCPHCPQTVASMLSLARECKQINLTVVDGELFSEVSGEARVRSVPTVILDDQFRWTGSVNVDEVVDMVVRRDPVHLGVSALKQMIEDGKAGNLAAMMTENHQVFPAFMDLLTHEKWPVRLGAMVVVEYLNDSSPSISLQILDELWAGFSGVDDSIKGDILYLFGESGRQEMTERLVAVTNGNYSDAVREAAKEIMADMDRERG